MILLSPVSIFGSSEGIFGSIDTFNTLFDARGTIGRKMQACSIIFGDVLVRVSCLSAYESSTSSNTQFPAGTEDTSIFF